MTKYELLNLLNDVEVQRKILHITKEDNAIFKEESPKQEVVEDDKPFALNSSPTDNSQEKIDQLESIIKELRTQLQMSNSENQRISTYDRQLQEARNEIFQLKNSLSKAEQHAKDLRSELEDVKSDYQHSKRQIAELKKIYQNDLAAWQENNRQLEIDKDILQEKIDKLREELAQRFERGWELFQQYQNVSTHALQILKAGVFTHDDFMSFICGGAQTNSLEAIWDLLKECVMNGQQQDAEILWDIFEYCIELVNSSKVQASYSILSVNEGDRFDSDYHTEGPNSKAQGQISRIYLPGYRNNYNGRIIKKSIVQVS